ncbi:diphthine methyl ester synthase [Coccinella septempunctata]|uniref:diphthine methyl ester synthase n=1 Tax=Coccinella septempunctata TaxID=41139 RepID=UPI001D081B63|nr:diphthine methyl ester synthase [Coccinella septempunctata]
MFYVIGLGLGDCKDITVKGLEIIKKCDRLYLESYTSILSCPAEELEEFYGQKPIIADRELVEQQAEVILEGANEKNIAFLVVGDPFGATTHTDLILRAKQNGIKVKVIHNASIMNAVGCCGLQLYTFGETISIPYWTDTWKPDSFFEKIIGNYKRNLHTLCLLDIKVKEPTLESLTKKKREYMPPLFMSVKEASRQLLEILRDQKNNESGITEESLCIGLARVGSDEESIIACSLKKMAEVDLGPPLHCMVIAGPTLHPLELEYVEQFKI